MRFARPYREAAGRETRAERRCQLAARMIIVGAVGNFLTGCSLEPALIRELKSLLGTDNVLSQTDDLMLYEFDGSVEKARPEVVVFPRTTDDVSRIVKLAKKYQAPIVGRGAGTGLSGGALARGGGVMIVFARMNKILEIDLASQRAVVQPGVVNADITPAVEHAGRPWARIVEPVSVTSTMASTRPSATLASVAPHENSICTSTLRSANQRRV